jgi:hypothetical protein
MGIAFQTGIHDQQTLVHILFFDTLAVAYRYRQHASPVIGRALALHYLGHFSAAPEVIFSISMSCGRFPPDFTPLVKIQIEALNVNSCAVKNQRSIDAHTASPHGPRAWTADRSFFATGT